jgi:arabinogalactan oligomer / maltooligosaccharide transport system permease protein
MSEIVSTISSSLKQYSTFFKEGSAIRNLSFIIMGALHLSKGQLVKGSLFLSAEIGFILFMILQGFSAIGGLLTLGTVKQGWVMDKELGIEVLAKGDNSMLILIYGIMAITLCILFICVYHAHFKSMKYISELEKKGLAIPKFKDDVKSLLDDKFHITLLSIPIIGVLVFTVVPLIYMISIAFTSFDHNHLPPKNLFDWVGFANFSNVLTGRMAGTFFPLLGWTLTWAFMATATSFIFGVLLALLINKKGIKGKAVFRTLFVLTMAVPQFVSLLIMRNLLHASGPVNVFLEEIGLISAPIPFLTDGLIAKLSVITINMWIGIPVTMLVATGILMNLPSDQIEAAKIDGANGLQILKSITFPQILFVMTPSLIQQFVGNINNFNVIYLLTEGGPVNSNYYSAGETDLLVTWLYKLTIETADYNIASVIGIITFVLSAVFSLFIYTRSNSFKKEDGLG